MTKRESGQAAVEAALVLPLTLFLILGSLQLFLLQQSRITAQYAAFQAARTGSLGHGACLPMTHAALLVLLPNIDSFIGDKALSGTPAQKLGQEFRKISQNHYGGMQWGTWKSAGSPDEAIVWLAREGRAPTVNDVLAFDQPITGGSPFRMELRMVYWAPLRIPFADWVYARIAAARMGLIPYKNYDPLMPAKKSTDWSLGGSGYTFDGLVMDEFSRRIQAGHYVFPITTASSMRMMTPPRLSEFDNPMCPAPGL